LPNSHGPGKVLSDTDDVVRQENTAMEDGLVLENSFGQREGQNRESASDIT